MTPGTRSERNRGVELQGLAARRVNETQRCGVQQESVALRLNIWWRIERITEDRVADRQQMHAQLMPAAGDGFEFEPRGVAFGTGG